MTTVKHTQIHRIDPAMLPTQARRRLSMLNNLVLRRLRYALDLREVDMRKILQHCDHDLPEAEIARLLAPEDDPQFEPCTDHVLTAFLDGLVIERRGRREPEAQHRPTTDTEQLTNNSILKKLKIALELREQHMLDIMAAAQFRISKGELGALLRRPGTRQYKPCGDQILRNFLIGLCNSNRPSDPPAAPQ